MPAARLLVQPKAWCNGCVSAEIAAFGQRANCWSTAMQRRFALAPSCALAFLAFLAPLAPANAAAPAPELSVATLDGQSLDLAGMRGHVVIVNFWATWCAPCIQEIPALEDFYEHNHARGLDVVALSEDRTRDIDDVRKMVQRLHMRYPVAMAHKASRNGFGEQSSLPVTFVIDAGGVLRAEMRPDTQPLTEENLTRVVDPLLRVR